MRGQPARVRRNGNDRKYKDSASCLALRRPSSALLRLNPSNSRNTIGSHFGLWLSLVQHLVRDERLINTPIYSHVLSLVKFEIETNKSLADTAIPAGNGRPTVVISAGFTVAPEMVYCHPAGVTR
jgi:hypothetical protein